MTGQFADLLEKTCERKVDYRILKYDGRPYSVEEVTQYVRNIIS